ncbi:MAG: DUF3048 domain-containing protein [Actinomycetota bacterium]|nr:DUF3048 domain-containing protein [Actinomycetota bacterium]
MADNNSNDSAPNPSSGGTGGIGGKPTRSELRKSGASGGSRWWIYAIAGLAVLVVAAGIALAATAGSHSATKAVATTTTAAAAPPAGPTCPLTGTPAPGGTVPARPALGVKIGNYPSDRPSAGLNHADIVFEEPVEGAITRLVAVFQCRGDSLVGDLRSAREPDVGILSQLSNPLFVHAGGIIPVIDLLQNSALIDDNLYTGGRGSVIINEPGRVAPYSEFAKTADLWAFNPKDTTPPAPIFHYSKALPAGAVPGSGVSAHIPFSGTSDVTWTWNPAGNDYLRSYSTGPDMLVDGTQTAATNIVIMTVQTSIGPWYENNVGGKEVEVNALGSGPAVILRNGVAITGTWNRGSLTQPNVFTGSNGQQITLAPGNTWEELVPAGVNITVTPAPAAGNG